MAIKYFVTPEEIERFLKLEEVLPRGEWHEGRLPSWHGDTGQPFRNVYCGIDDKAVKITECTTEDCDTIASFIVTARNIMPAVILECQREKDRADRLDSKLNETFTDEQGTVWTRPTAWAYAQVCKALEKMKEAHHDSD